LSKLSAAQQNISSIPEYQKFIPTKFPTRDDRNVRFSNIRDHPIQRALTEAHRGSYVACQGAATLPSPTVLMPQSSDDEGGQEGVETGDSGEGGEVETRDDFNDLTMSTFRETNVLPSSDEDNIDENSQQLPEEDGAEKGNRKRHASKSPPAQSQKKKPTKK